MARNGFNSALACSRLFCTGSRLHGRKMSAKIADGELPLSNANSYWTQNLLLSAAATNVVVQRLLSTNHVKAMNVNAAAAAATSPAAYVDEKFAEVASSASIDPQRYTMKKTEVWLDELIELLDAGKIRLIDVREPSEIEEMGSIPTSINIPLTELKKALLMSDFQFQKTYGIVKPNRNDNRMVFYGLTHVRSAAAVELAQRLGYKRVRQYVGGWYEWSIMCRTDC